MALRVNFIFTCKNLSLIFSQIFALTIVAIIHALIIILRFSQIKDNSHTICVDQILTKPVSSSCLFLQKKMRVWVWVLLCLISSHSHTHTLFLFFLYREFFVLCSARDIVFVAVEQVRMKTDLLIHHCKRCLLR
jgi:hypothetical protein